MGWWRGWVGLGAVLVLLASARAQLDEDMDEDFPVNEDSGGALEGIAPVADPDHSAFPVADHLDDDFRPPDAEGDDEQEQDLGAVQTLSSDPTADELAHIQHLALDDDSIDESKPPPPPPSHAHAHHHHHHDHHHDHAEGGSVEQVSAHHHERHPHPRDHGLDEQANLAIGGSVQANDGDEEDGGEREDGEDGGEEGKSGKGHGVSGQGFPSRATAAYDEANRAIEKARRAAEEAKLAIQAAEAAKREADEVVRRGGDGGPATDLQDLLAIGGGGEGEAEHASRNADAADLGLPNPNPPLDVIRSLRASEAALGAVNNAQLGEGTGTVRGKRVLGGTRGRKLVDMHQALVHNALQPMAHDGQRHSKAHVEEGDGDEDSFRGGSHARAVAGSGKDNGKRAVRLQGDSDDN